jgi:hypothetical protein
LKGVVVTDSFLRQRRNLYIATGILFFSFLAKVNVSKLTIAGISFESFDNPEVFYAFLWVIWFYFLYRFVVYFIEDEKEAFLKMWVREIHRYTNPKLEKIARENCEFEYSGNVNGYYSMKECGWIIHFQETWEHEAEGCKVINKEIPISYVQVVLPVVRGAARFCLVTPAITNYILPLALSLLLLFTVGFATWEGALVQSIN